MKPISAERLKSLAAAKPTFLRILQRAVILLPLGLAFGLLAWSVHRLQPVLRATSAATERVTRMSAQIDDIDRARVRAETEGVSQQFQKAMGEYASGEEAVRDWMIDLRERAATLAFSMTADIGEVSSREVGGQTLTFIPVRIELQSNEDLTPSRTAYKRLMDLCRFLSSHRLRVDVTEMSVVGSEGTAGRAVLAVQLWARTSTS